MSGTINQIHGHQIPVRQGGAIYLSPNADQRRLWSGQGRCATCGSQPDPKGCFCRECKPCSRYWLSTERMDGVDGEPQIQPCPDCLLCEGCGDDLDDDRAGEPCFDCRAQIKREQDEKEYWEEVNRTAYAVGRAMYGPELEEFEARTEQILSTLDRGADQAVVDVVASLDQPKAA